MVKNFRIYKNFNLSKKDKEAIILIGNFDGLHSGHQKLFQLAKKYKTKYKSKIGVVTFDPIQKMFFNKKIRNYRLSNFNQKVLLLKKFGVDFIINKNFDKKFSKITYISFIKNILSKKLTSKFIFVSNNFRFGFKREGDVQRGDASQEYYIEWLETQDQNFLDEIESYNKQDCISTFQLHKWLLGIKPSETSWFIDKYFFISVSENLLILNACTLDLIVEINF